MDIHCQLNERASKMPSNEITEKMQNDILKQVRAEDRMLKERLVEKTDIGLLGLKTKQDMSEENSSYASVKYFTTFHTSLTSIHTHADP